MDPVYSQNWTWMFIYVHFISYPCCFQTSRRMAWQSPWQPTLASFAFSSSRIITRVCARGDIAFSACSLFFSALGCLLNMFKMQAKTCKDHLTCGFRIQLDYTSIMAEISSCSKQLRHKFDRSSLFHHL